MEHARSDNFHGRLFTLIELLVVIAIIAILAALLFPALKKAHDRARKVLCGSNLKNIGTVIACYANDYNEYLPPYNADTWKAYDLDKTSTNVSTIWKIFMPYLTNDPTMRDYASWGQVFFCPLNKEVTFKYLESGTLPVGFKSATGRSSYLYEFRAPPMWSAGLPRKLTVADPPPRAGLTFTNYRIVQDLTIESNGNPASQSNHLKMIGPGAAIPYDEGNFLFVDGAVRELKKGEDGFQEKSFAN